MRATEIVAEIGQAHDGSVGILHSYIDALADCGVDAVKFQMHLADAESSPWENFRVPFSHVDATRQDYWRRMELDANTWAELKAHCEKRQVEFLVSPFSVAAVGMLESLGVARYKLGSGEITNLLLLEVIARTGKPVILSSGLSSFQELDAAIAVLRDRDTAITVLQCATKYPSQPADVGLNVLSELQDRYDLPIGLSDHSGTIFPGLAAAAMGADLIEFHAVFDHRMFGPDAGSSLTMDQIEQLVAGIDAICEMRANPVDKSSPTIDPALKNMFGKALAVNKNLPAGHVVTLEDLETKKPADRGIAAADYEQVIGSRLTRDIAQWDFLNTTDIEGFNSP